MHPDVAGDPRVTVIEGLNARDLAAAELAGRIPDFIVSDVSFISLKLALPPALAIAKAGTGAVFLVTTVLGGWSLSAAAQAQTPPPPPGDTLAPAPPAAASAPVQRTVVSIAVRGHSAFTATPCARNSSDMPSTHSDIPSFAIV